LAKTNYAFEKRQREQAKRKKQEAKRQRKASTKGDAEAPESLAAPDTPLPPISDKPS